MNRFAAGLLALAPALIFAQAAESSKPSPELVTKVIHVRYGIAESMASTLNAGSPVMFRGNNGLRAIVVRGKATEVAAAEQTIKELDVPFVSEAARDIEVRIYVIGAGPKAQGSSATEPDMEPVVRQLKAAFPYGNYQLLDTMLLRSREGETARTDGMMKSFPAGQEQHANSYAIEYHLVMEPGDMHRTIRLDKFQFRTHSGREVEGSRLNVGFETDLQVHEGQKIVVGKTNIEDGDSALFVVLAAKVLE